MSEQPSELSVPLTEDQTRTLMSAGFTCMVDGSWSKTTPLHGGGYNVGPPVDVQAELMRIEAAKSVDTIMALIGGRMIEELDIATGAVHEEGGAQSQDM